MKKIHEGIPYQFLKKYEKAIGLKKDKLLKPITKNVLSILKIKDEKLRWHTLTGYLRSYFDDLIEYFNCKEEEVKRS